MTVFINFQRLKRVIDHNKGRVKVAIALKNSHNQWQQTNANNKEGNRKNLEIIYMIQIILLTKEKRTKKNNIL